MILKTTNDNLIIFFIFTSWWFQKKRSTPLAIFNLQFHGCVTSDISLKRYKQKNNFQNVLEFKLVIEEILSYGL